MLLSLFDFPATIFNKYLLNRNNVLINLVFALLCLPELQITHSILLITNSEHCVSFVNRLPMCKPYANSRQGSRKMAHNSFN